MNLELKNETERKNNMFDDVEIIVDPELEDESTVDINDYLNKYILQCRICGNMFPSTDILDNDTECPICDSKSANGFIYKGKLLKKNNKEKDLSDEEINAIKDLNDEIEENHITDDETVNIFTQGDFSQFKKDDLSDNQI